MKTQLILKIAVVAMAAFGAYAFSGNAKEPQMFTRNDTCDNIPVGCADDGLFLCKVRLSNNQIVDILDSECEELIYHTSNTPINWKD